MIFEANRWATGSGAFIFPAVALLSLVSLPALANDWSARTSLSESVEASDNRALNTDSAGATYLFTSQLMVDAIARAETSSLELRADVSYENLTGPGADQNASPIDNTVNLRFDDRLSETLSYDIGGRWQRRDATTAQLDDTGVVILGGAINTFVVQGGITRQVNPRDVVQLSTTGTLVDFTSDAGSSFTDLLTGINWTHRLTPTIGLTTNAQIEWISRDDPASGDTYIARATYGLETPITTYLAFQGDVGASFQNTKQDTTAPSLGSPQSQSESSVDLLADLAFTYRPLPTTEFALTASHWTGPNVLGSVESRTIVGVNLRHSINQLSMVWASSTYTGQIPLIDLFDQDDANYVRAAVGYDYRLTPEWVAQLSYRYAHRSASGLDDDPQFDAGSAQSNTLYFAIVHEATILP